MTDLCDDAKQAIVTHLAQFRSLAETAKLVSQDFGITVDRFQVRTYDPTNPRCACGERLRALFDEVRRKYIEGVDSVPASHRGYRMATLQRQIDEAQRIGAIKLTAELLAQAAKEMGGMFDADRPVRQIDPPVPRITAAEARERLKAKIEQINARHAARQ